MPHVGREMTVRAQSVIIDLKTNRSQAGVSLTPSWNGSPLLSSRLIMIMLAMETMRHQHTVRLTTEHRHLRKNLIDPITIIDLDMECI
jgi:hypothetical protein